MTPSGIAENVADVADAHRPGAAGRNGENAGLEMVAPGPFDQAGIHTLAGFLFKDLPAFVLVHNDAIHHHAVNVERVTADRRAHGQWEIKIPCQRTVEVVTEDKGHPGFGDEAE